MLQTGAEVALYGTQSPSDCQQQNSVSIHPSLESGIELIETHSDHSHEVNENTMNHQAHNNHEKPHVVSKKTFTSMNVQDMRRNSYPRQCGWPVVGGIPNQPMPTMTSSTSFNVQAAEFVPRAPNSASQSEEPVVQTTGKILTSLSIKLVPPATRAIPRNSTKLELTGKRAEKFEIDNSDVRQQRYKRDFLHSLRESKQSLELPEKLPNIPELLPTSKPAATVPHTPFPRSHMHRKSIY